MLSINADTSKLSLQMCIRNLFEPVVSGNDQLNSC